MHQVHANDYLQTNVTQLILIQANSNGIKYNRIVIEYNQLPFALSETFDRASKQLC